MNRRITVALSAIATLLVAGASLGQPGGGGGQGSQPAPREDGRRGGGGGGSQPGGGGAGGPGSQGGQGLIDRLLQNDANGDGQLQWDEVPEQFRDRIFERGDTNHDKVIDKAEIEAMRQRGPGRGPGGPGAAGEATSIHDAMQQAGRSMRALRRSEFKAGTRAQDLRAAQSLQSALIAAKGDLANARMSDAAKAKYKDDAATYEQDFRKSLIEGAMEALRLELAINAGDSAAAVKARDAILAMQDTSHELFQPAEEDRPARGPGGGGRPGGAAGGSGGGTGGEGGGRPPR